MALPAPHLSSSVSEQLDLLERQHDALLSTLKITHSIEQLHNGLEASLLLGKPSAQISPKVLETFSALSLKTEAMTTPKLQKIVLQLDQEIQGKVASILNIAKSEDFASMDKLFNAENNTIGVNDKLNHLIQDFRKKAQTAVALRILLQKRGISSAPIRHHVAEADIEKELLQLEQKEQQCRQQVQREITSLDRELTGLLQRHDISERTRLAATHIHSELLQDLEHIKAGKPFSQLPSAVEVIELRADEVAENSATSAVNSVEGSTAEQQEQAVVSATLAPETQCMTAEDQAQVVRVPARHQSSETPPQQAQETSLPWWRKLFLKFFA